MASSSGICAVECAHRFHVRLTNITVVWNFLWRNSVIGDLFFRCDLVNFWSYTWRIRSTLAHSLASRWSLDDMLVSFYISSIPGRGLSSRTPAPRLLRLSFLILLGQLQFANVCSRFAQVPGLKDLYNSIAGDLYSRRSFHLAVLECCCDQLVVHRYSPSPGSTWSKSL